MNFNPFKKEFEELRASDLEVLRSVREGWYNEYKSMVPSAASIAKSIGAFANHYGGWLFYGIEGCRSGENVAKSFPGIELTSWRSLQQRIRDAVALNLNPVPHFEVRMIEGPEPETELEAGRGVVAIRVSRGADAPYVHSSGVIYRRVADRSDSAPETDRHLLDLLWERGQRARRGFRDFLLADPELSRGEGELSFLTIYLFHDPLGDLDRRTNVRFKEFAEIMKDSSDEIAGMTFENCFSTGDGYIGRQVGNNAPFLQVPTWKHFLDGTSVIRLPIRSGSLQYTPKMPKYECFDTFVNTCRTAGYRTGDWIDLNLLLPAVASVITKQSDLLEAGGLKPEMWFKARLHDVWRKVPFLDTESYLGFIAEHGMPLIQTAELIAPPGVDYDTLQQVEVELEQEVRFATLRRAILPWIEICIAAGLEGLMKSAGNITELIQAGDRARRVHASSN